jgi:hypothetical protein
MDEAIDQLKGLMNDLFVDDIKKFTEDTKKDVSKKLQITIDQFNRELEDRIENSVAKTVKSDFEKLGKSVSVFSEKLNLIDNQIDENHSKALMTTQEIVIQLSKLESNINASIVKVAKENELYYEILLEEIKIIESEIINLKQENNNLAFSIQDSFESIRTFNKTQSENIISSYDVLSEEIKKIESEIFNLKKENEIRACNIQDSFNSIRTFNKSQSENIITRAKELYNQTKEKIELNKRGVKILIMITKTLQNKVDNVSSSAQSSLTALNDIMLTENKTIISEIKDALTEKISEIPNEFNTLRKIKIYLLILLVLSTLNLGLIVKLFLN